MRRTYLLLSVLLILSGLCACNKFTPLQPAANKLNGTWIGTYKTQQTGKFPADQTPVLATATFQIINHSLVASVYFTVGQKTSPEPVQFIGTLNDHLVRMYRSVGALCDPTRREYIQHLDGEIRGDTLTVAGQDTICPAQELIYLRTLELIRQ